VQSAQATAAAGQLGSEAVTTSGSNDGQLPSTASGGLHRTGPTSWSVDAGTPGWVVVPEEWSPGWKVEGLSGQPTLAGTVALRVSGGATEVNYSPWVWIRFGIIVSMLTLLGLLALGLWEHRVELADLVPGRHERPQAPA
jgi:hypothetical protein